jgi:hypothetical protein
VFYLACPLNLQIPMLVAVLKVCLHNRIEICIQQASSQTLGGDSGAMRVAMMSLLGAQRFAELNIISEILVLFGV